MDVQIQETWQQLTNAVSIEQNTSALTLGFYLLLGGLMALYIRFLYRRFGATANDADSITRVFPLLTLVTIGVIAVVKSSMALSLGLVGALSIVRFRAAIKEPEELVYLFLCIGVGLGLGAGQPLLAIVTLLVASLFIIGMHASNFDRRSQRLLLTISGDARRYFSDAETGVVKVVEQTLPHFVVQRLDIESDRGSLRIVIPQADPQAIGKILSELRQQLPDCELSYVNLESTI